MDCDKLFKFIASFTLFGYLILLVFAFYHDAYLLEDTIQVYDNHYKVKDFKNYESKSDIVHTIQNSVVDLFFDKSLVKERLYFDYDNQCNALKDVLEIFNKNFQDKEGRVLIPEGLNTMYKEKCFNNNADCPCLFEETPKYTN